MSDYTKEVEARLRKALACDHAGFLNASCSKYDLNTALDEIDGQAAVIKAQTNIIKQQDRSLHDAFGLIERLKGENNKLRIGQ